ncbi:hypothetical protein POTOM_032844 [Populus tomentosa]|uniref:Uncharacterized protein n=1 Tax=Populus tomentosa TaxID=118781 RepID=A0A8X8CQ50_POPTO|nr:hypothetical protein POTOM_032844 [Populus tomentosa]
MSTMQRLNLTSPLRIVINASSRMAILLLLSLLYTNPTIDFKLSYARSWIIVDVFVDFSCDWSFDFYFHPLNISASVLRLAWTAEVMRHVINLTVSEVLFVPAIEELIIITRGLICLRERMSSCLLVLIAVLELWSLLSDMAWLSIEEHLAVHANAHARHHSNGLKLMYEVSLLKVQANRQA